MNTAQNFHIKSDFKTVLNTVISYDHLEILILECNDILFGRGVNTTKMIRAVRCKVKLMKLIEGMKDIQQMSDDGFTADDIDRFNIEYSNISDLMSSLKEKIELVPQVQRTVLQITTDYTENIEKRQSTMAPPEIRKERIHRTLFGEYKNILPDEVVEQKRAKMIATLSDDPISANIYKGDCLAANDEKFPENELSNSMIAQALRSAKMRQDGAYIQSIKNNLIQNAANDTILDSSLESSSCLADHMGNIRPDSPIVLQTVEYGYLNILSSKTVEYGDTIYYDALISFGDGTTKRLILSSRAFIVGDLSDKIIGEVDPQGQITIKPTLCTIRRIRSSRVAKKPVVSTIKDQGIARIKKGFQGLKSMFGFGQKISSDSSR